VRGDVEKAALSRIFFKDTKNNARGKEERGESPFEDGLIGLLGDSCR